MKPISTFLRRRARRLTEPGTHNGAKRKVILDTRDQLVTASRTNGPNGAADAAYNYSYSFDEVGNRTNEVRGQQEGPFGQTLKGTFNNLNQLRTRLSRGRLPVVGTVAGTNVYAVKVDGTNALIYCNSATNFLGGAVLDTGSNQISVVTVDTTLSTTSETTFVVYAPPTQPQAFTWDKNGCMTSDGYRNLTWNEECRLKEIETSAAAVTMGLPKRKSAFVYDGLGRRCKRTDYSEWNGSDYAATNITKYVWDGFNILAELHEDNSIKSYMVWGLDVSQSLQGAGGVGGLLAMHRSGTNYLYTYCGNGNVTDVLDDQGSVVARYERDPFGRIVKQTGSFAIENPWGFSTKMFDRVWGIVEFELRPTYSPDLGRFLSRDPIEEEGSIHLYIFAFNTPQILYDYLGLQVLEYPGAPHYPGRQLLVGFANWRLRVRAEKERRKKLEINKYEQIAEWFDNCECIVFYKYSEPEKPVGPQLAEQRISPLERLLQALGSGGQKPLVLILERPPRAIEFMSSYGAALMEAYHGETIGATPETRLQTVGIPGMSYSEYSSKYPTTSAQLKGSTALGLAQEGLTLVEGILSALERFPTVQFYGSPEDTCEWFLWGRESAEQSPRELTEFQAKLLLKSWFRAVGEPIPKALEQ